MVNFHDPTTIIRQSNEIMKFWSLVDGIFIWEFMITLDYEWSVIRGRRPYRWTIWIYSLARVATLVAVALNIFSIDVMTQINCQVAVDLQFTFAYLAFASSSLLIVLRMYVLFWGSLWEAYEAVRIAIWDRKRIVVALATGVWGIDIAFLIQGVLRFRSSWQVEKGCVFYLDSIRLSTIVTFAADTTLLLIMLFGLYRLRRHGHGMMALGRLLWNQGVVWLLLVVATELTPMVLILLNLNRIIFLQSPTISIADLASTMLKMAEIMNIMFHVPCMVAMSIAATRMYRSLSDFLSSDVSQKIPPTNFLESIGTSTSARLTGIQVAVHTIHERSMPPANHYASNISGQPHGKPHELIVDVVNDHDIEGGAEK